eukprot:CAMPEP_0194254926 /NCGR_PEP_ID=MMETSP0158-20130606/33234_1 /TAXON_ID=33649 /ORGANISM="Thalassionema nitzschioides, Strain L26-B" /LENGTH=235 /DNA_ID=CAMNT_0038993137 /DNA_START=55 /DNA_END=762 /DNA_ORIENTATION=-
MSANAKTNKNTDNEDHQQVPSIPSNTEPELIAAVDQNIKVDEITAIQDSIDGLSLAMFEALRGLRDAVAPESGNLSSDNNSNTQQQEQQQNESSSGGASPDFEEFWQSYRNNDPDIVAAVKRVGGGVSPQLTRREDYVRIFALWEREKDAELVTKLATCVLHKSADIDDRVMSLQGMNRTRTEQMERIAMLLKENQAVKEELDSVHALASKRRDEVRSLLQEQTCEALGIEEFTQ